MIELVALTVAVIAVVAATIGLCQSGNRSRFPSGVQYSLRSLVILVAIGPPLLAGLWTHRGRLIQVWDAALSPVPKSTPRQPSVRHFPLQYSTLREESPRESIQRQREERAQHELRQAAAMWTELYVNNERTLHSVAGACAAVLYPVGVVLTAGVFWRSSSWKRPPRKTPLLWAAVTAAVLAAAACLLFFATLRWYEPTPQEAYRDYQRLVD
jgi:hypothetical protein